MGQIAEQYADKIIITDDNPRTEQAKAIVNDILVGLKNPKAVQIQHHRAQAIAAAINAATVDDIVLIAGKGHEDYQEIHGQRTHFSDAEEVHKSLFSPN
jgi:UDP-N-acetylmuramoyl-L-alanyl-D-glutamate--2,6-diaminopimelate ligase